MGKDIPGTATPYAIMGVCKKVKKASRYTTTESGVSEGRGGRKGREVAGLCGPMRDALLLVILVCYSENTGETSCFGEIVPAVA